MRLRPAGETIRREIVGETILVPIRGRIADLRRVYGLNPTASFVWERLDGRRTVAEILADLVATFEVDEERARVDLEGFIAEARAEGLIEEAP